MAVLVFACFTMAGTAWAQVEVVESYPTIRGNSNTANNQSNNSPSSNNTYPQNTSRSNQPVGNSNVRPITEVADSDAGPGPTVNPQQSADLYSRYQQMELEVSQLRGTVEELTNELKKLKQQMLDDYVELDKRIAQVSGGEAAGGGANSIAARGGNTAIVAGAATSANVVSGGNTATAAAGEVDSYKNALNMLLQSKDYDGAITAFNTHLQRFPGGQYDANVLFWLGQVYVIQGKNSDAEKSYSRLIQNYPNHDKAWEARFALGKIYFQQGDKAKAKPLITEVASSGSDVAPLARNFIQDNSL